MNINIKLLDDPNVSIIFSNVSSCAKLTNYLYLLL